MATENKDFKVKNGLIVGGTGLFNGTVTVATPTANDHAATKQYVDENAGGGSLTIGDTPPASPSEGDLWYNSLEGSTYVYYDSFWVESTSAYAGPTGIVNALAPLSFNTSTDTLSIDLSAYYDSSQVDTAISNAITSLIDAAPEALNTLNELAAALGDDPNFITTISTSLSTLEQRVEDLEMMMMMEAM